VIDPVILFQPPNQIGLGHINRLAVIASAVRQVNPNAQVPFAVAGASHSLLEAYRLPYLSIPPSLDLDGPGPWEPWPLPDRQMVSTSISYSILRGLKVNLVVFDCFPSFAMVRAAAHCGVPMVLVLREMRDMERYMDTIRDAVSLCQSIVVVHDPGTVELPSLAAGKVKFVGEVVRPLPRASERATNHGSDCYPIVISGGGGGTPGALAFYNLAIAAVTQLYRANPHRKTLLVTGPLFQQWHALELTEAVTVVPFDAEISRRFSEAELVISLAGYNTIAELGSCHVRGICIPSWTPYDDQVARALKVTRDDPNVRIYQGNSCKALASLITECINTPYRDTTSKSHGGAMQAAEYLCSIATAPSTGSLSSS
jgi:predicted glycosyltransferase